MPQAGGGGAQPPWTPQSYPVAPPPGGGGNNSSNTVKIVIGIVVVLILGGVGVVLATRGGDKKKAVADVTLPTEDITIPSVDITVPSVTVTIPPTTTTEVPTTTTEPPTTTTEAPTTTTEPATTTTVFTVPAGAVDLGDQVYVPLPSGWTDSKDANGLDTLTDGTNKILVQELQRTAGEDPKAVLQEYFDGFDTQFTPISLSPSLHADGDASAVVPSDDTTIFYTGWDAANGIGVDGAVHAFQRADGLTVLYDVFSSGATMGISDDAFGEFLKSFWAAPAVGPVATLNVGPSFRLNAPQAPILLDGLLGFTPAPGFTQAAAGNLYGQAIDGAYSFAVSKLVTQAGLDAALMQVQGSLNNAYTNVMFGAVQPFDDYNGLKHEGIAFTGTANAGGTPGSGAIDVYFDPNTTNAIAMVRTWPTTADGSEPNKSEETFMTQSVADCLAAIGVP
jgi:hypothetical protein